MEDKKKPETYKKEKKLGEGNFGSAYLVRCGSDNSYAVIKQIDLSQASEQELEETLKEAKILEAFDHPNIVKFKEVYKTKKGMICIVMDYADGGDLSEAIKQQEGLFSEDQILDWFTQIALAIKHIHDRKVLHRDLKSQNIFLMKDKSIKLGDFGVARVLSKTKSVADTITGTPVYISPEMLDFNENMDGSKYDCNGYNHSFTVRLYCMNVHSNVHAHSFQEQTVYPEVEAVNERAELYLVG